MTAPVSTPPRCRLCQSERLELRKESSAAGPLTSRDFAITDGRYGQTLAIWECGECGLRQAFAGPELLSYYESLQDPEYEAGRAERKRQARELIARALRSAGLSPKGMSLLDVGAGSGIAVEAAREMGLRAEGVEPSRWLQQIAARAGLPVALGTIDNLPAGKRFDLVLLADVIEHVEDPVGLLRACAKRLADNGAVVVATPDCRSVAARLMGWRWWHYRIAHVTYFSRVTLLEALRRASLAPLRIHRPGWRFPASYLLERLGAYLPRPLIPRWRFLERISVPLNLYDSLLAVARRMEGE